MRYTWRYGVTEKAKSQDPEMYVQDQYVELIKTVQKGTFQCIFNDDVCCFNCAQKNNEHFMNQER